MEKPHNERTQYVIVQTHTAIIIYIYYCLDTVKYHESGGQVFAARVQILAYQTSDISRYLGNNRFIIINLLITMQWRRLPLTCDR